MAEAVALGFWHHGGAGCESIHARFKAIEQSFVHQIHHRVDRLRAVVRESHLRVAPANQKCVPPPKKRKKDEGENGQPEC